MIPFMNWRTTRSSRSVVAILHSEAAARERSPWKIALRYAV
jgi:hypothetical protein